MNKEQLKKLQSLRERLTDEQYRWRDPLGPEFANAILTGDMSNLAGMLRGQSYGQGANAQAYLSSAVNSLSEALGPYSSQDIPFPRENGEVIQRRLRQVKALVRDQKRW